MNPVAEKIIAEAREEAAEIRREGEEKCAAVHMRREDEFRAVREEGENRIRAEAHSLFRRREAMSIREARMELLREKRRIMDETVGSLENEILSDPVLYGKVIRSILVRAAVPGEWEIVPCAEDRPLYTAEFMDDLGRRIREARGFSPVLQLSGDNIREKGIMARQGRTVVDGRIGVVIGLALRDIEGELAQILFGGEG